MRLFGMEIRRAGETRSSLENPTVSLRDPDGIRRLFGMSDWMTAAGVNVTPETAMGVPAFAAGVNFIARTLAGLPMQQFKKTDAGRERITDGMLSSILSGTVNDDFLTTYKWRQRAMVSVFLTGAGRTYVEKNAAGQPQNLWPLETGKTEKARVGGRTVYHYRQSGVPAITYQASEVIDISWIDKLDGVSIFNPLERFRETFGLAIAAQRYGAKYFQNGGVPPLALKGPLGSPAAAARAKTDIAGAVRAANKAGDPVLSIPDGYELVPIGFDPEKGQLVDLQRFLIEEFARILNLPPVFLQDLTHGTFSNTEQQDLQLVKHSLTQWVMEWTQECNAKFYNERVVAKYVEFILDAILRGDFKTRTEGWARAIQTGQATPNEARRAENRPDVAGGDSAYIQGATVPLEMAGKVNATAPADPSADPAVDPEAGDPLTGDPADA